MLYVVGFALVWLPVVAVVLVARSRQSRRAWWRVRAWWSMRQAERGHGTESWQEQAAYHWPGKDDD